MELRIEVDRDSIAGFCRNHRIRKLSLFGSVLRDDFGEESDVDILVEFEPDARVGLIGMGAMALELSGIVRRNVDLRTPADLSRYFRDEVLAKAEVLYAA